MKNAKPPSNTLHTIAADLGINRYFLISGDKTEKTTTKNYERLQSFKEMDIFSRTGIK